MFKSQLQEFCQKAGVSPPVYDFTREGPSHQPRFKATVTVAGSRHESAAGFTNLKKAEHAAAKAALEAFSKSFSGNTLQPDPLEDSGLCKNLLQEYAQKLSLPLPIYRTQKSGQMHLPTFISSVEIAGGLYNGGIAKSKKEAEVKAAKTALLQIHSETRYAQGLQNSSSKRGMPNTHLQHAEGKKRGRSSSSLSEPLTPKKAAKVKQAKVDVIPLAGASTIGNEVTEVDMTAAGDVKPAFLAATLSSIEIPGLEMGSEIHQDQETKQEQGQKVEHHQTTVPQGATSVVTNVDVP